MKKKGFTLLECIITIALLSIVTIACMGILSSALTAKYKSDEMLTEQVALKQALMTITREIRKNPEKIKNEILETDSYTGGEYGNDGNIFYELIDNDLWVYGKDDDYIIQNIASCILLLDQSKVFITVQAVGGTTETAAIHLRIGVK